ncbi:Cyclic di-GMP phosphodiesterase response regulator RpfG [Posidoniimonas polymericola]|uniref:Cyclic di-GMP phosphodiesterase response regulator RpfG n=1 Tax=Posidoniimonas polymericola TaxID=2528002 RepID=A0A5C5YQP4_9BACT|nr:HD domain-containing phosphohydrolase [Posidoniimonas polymericola]TWT77128.1 Cyclic di-GMP phosphodiesterase response regulator RpfG [Posidoniimonas polymericola]
MQVLIAEDDRSSSIVLQGVLGALGYDVLAATDGQTAWELLRDNDCRIVISDWQMPRMDGLELCRRVRARDVGCYVYFILLTSRSGSHNLVEGLQAGADDFVTKPFDAEELRVRMKSAERVVSLESRDLIIFTLAKLAESRDPETGAHLERVREYVRILCKRLQDDKACRGKIDQDFIQLMYLSSPLHDIGKVGIPDNVLLKPGRLTDEEMDCMREHTVIGGTTLDAALASHPSASFLRVASEIAWTHHERYDGRGYPNGLAGKDIPLSGRIMALADVYDALTTKRVYKDAMSHETAREILLEGRGTQFDPAVVDAFLAGESDFLRIKKMLQDSEPLAPQATPALAPTAS